MSSSTDEIRGAFKEHQTEIQRRVRVTHEIESINPDTFEKRDDGISAGPFVCTEQQWFLFSVSHVAMPPICDDDANPAVRIYGAFETTDEARNHAALVSASDPHCNLQLARTHEWCVAASTIERTTDPQYAATKVKALLATYEELRTSNREQFTKNVLEKHIPLPAQSVSDDEEEKRTSPKRELGGGMQRAQRLPRTVDVRDQQLVVMSFLPDLKCTPPEFLFRVYRCTESKEEADRYVRNVAGDIVKNFDIDVVSACEWLHPQKCIDGRHIQQEIYRSNELGKIINCHKSQPDKVESFRRWREDDESSIPFGAVTAAPPPGAIEACSTSAAGAPPVAGSP